ncbi:molybdenum ABC transporter ATP-binding protein [Martelella mediterranea]|uniref:molybdenum ABC transporter ATP-binding protein n=1 Tax=Martelella mediterranea TaxID=293089 RepID=UPI001E449091|nr:molybdenum ABC transporter ATP-binding protein [Martelella mediterranea]MCD1634163.1 molybdenum ABC transporter ATP-binding protein [Martelella mediterranea]
MTGDRLSARFAGRFGAFLLDASFRFPKSGVTALFGPSGCGKTSLLRCFAGLEHLPDGEFSIDGEVWQDGSHFRPPHRREVGYVFQQANLFPHLTVSANLRYGEKRAKRDGKARFEELVELLGLSSLLERMPARLSGGERQRVAIARALLSQPKLLLMDEPMSALDIHARQEIFPYLQNLRQSLSIPVLYVTHAPDEVARLADHLAVMRDGRVIAAGLTAETLARLDLPMAHERRAGIAIDARIADIDLRWQLALAKFEGGALWIAHTGRQVGEPVRLMIHARDVSIALTENLNVSIINRVPAIVREIARGDHPSVMIVHLEIGSRLIMARVTARSANLLSLQPGMAVYAQIKSVAIID